MAKKLRINNEKVRQYNGQKTKDKQREGQTIQWPKN